MRAMHINKAQPPKSKVTSGGTVVRNPKSQAPRGNKGARN